MAYLNLLIDDQEKIDTELLKQVADFKKITQNSLLAYRLCFSNQDRDRKITSKQPEQNQKSPERKKPVKLELSILLVLFLLVLARSGIRAVNTRTQETLEQAVKKAQVISDERIDSSSVSTPQVKMRALSSELIQMPRPDIVGENQTQIRPSTKLPTQTVAQPIETPSPTLIKQATQPPTSTATKLMKISLPAVTETTILPTNDSLPLEPPAKVIPKPMPGSAVKPKEVKDGSEQEHYGEFYRLVTEFIHKLNAGLELPPNRLDTAVISVGVLGSEHYQLPNGHEGVETDGNFLVFLTAHKGEVYIQVVSPFNRDMTATVDPGDGPPYLKVKQLYSGKAPWRYRLEMEYVAGQPIGGMMILSKDTIGKLGETAFPEKGWQINVLTKVETPHKTFFPGKQYMTAKEFTWYIAARKGVTWVTKDGKVLTQTDAREAKAASALRDIVGQLINNPRAMVHLLNDGMSLVQMDERFQTALLEAISNHGRLSQLVKVLASLTNQSVHISVSSPINNFKVLTSVICFLLMLS